MNRSFLAALTATMLLSVAPATAPAHATTAIARCQSPDGTSVYTDRACTAFGAKPLPLPGQLLSRIYREQARQDDGVDGATNSIPVVATARRPATGGCARTPTQLAMDLRGSLAMGDVNRVAESYHWVGMSSREGERTLDRLQHLIGKPVLDSHYFDAQIAAASISSMPDAGSSLVASSDASSAGEAGMLQLALADNSVVDFDVRKYAGCYFVKF
jgi:hypothetical protein